MKRSKLIAVLLILLIVSVLTTSCGSRSISAGDVASRPITVEASTIYNKCNDYQSEARKLYKDKWVRITGTVAYIGNGLAGISNNTYITFNFDKKDFSQIVFYFDRDSVSNLTGIKKGQKVAIVGQVTSTVILLGILAVYHCTIDHVY